MDKIRIIGIMFIMCIFALAGCLQEQNQPANNQTTGAGNLDRRAHV